MEKEEAITVLASLAQPTRLQAFRLLVQHEPEGLTAGELARLLVVPPNTLSAHLNVLSQAGLTTATRKSRCIIYRASVSRLTALTTFLAQDCCGGRGCEVQPAITCTETFP